jgi:short-subunit dehydrogenase
MEIRGTTIVVTGASGGAGQAIARALHAGGARVVLTGRRVEEMEALSAQLPGSVVMPGDLSDRADLDRLLDDLGTLGAVDGLVANAALPATGRIEEYTTEQLDRALDVNLRAPMVMTMRLLPGMLERGRGHLAFVSSMGGKMGTARLSVYSTTKFALRGFGASLRQDLVGSGVSSSVVFPGSIIDGGMLTDAGLGASPGTKGVTCAAVADAVVRAITRDIGEVDVTDLTVRVASKVLAVAPNLSDRMQNTKMLAYAEQLTEGMRDKR